jgi:hypothetical protein
MKLKLKNVRLSFPNLFEAEQYEGKGPFNYSRVVLDRRTTTRSSRPIDEAIKAARARPVGCEGARDPEGGPARQEGVLLDRRRPQGSRGHTGSCPSHRKQDDGRPLSSTSRRTRWSPATASPTPAATSTRRSRSTPPQAEHRQVRCGLIGVQFAADGDAFGGGSKPSADDFDEIEQGAGADALA